MTEQPIQYTQNKFGTNTFITLSYMLWPLRMTKMENNYICGNCWSYNMVISINQLTGYTPC